MQKIYVLVAIGFCLFLGFIIYTANTGNEMPLQQVIRSISHGDKLAHFTLFGLLSFLLNLAVTTKRFQWRRWSIYRGTAIVAVFAVFEEGSQRYISSRTFEYLDLAADLSGVLVFAVISAWFIKDKPRSCLMRFCKNKASV